MWIAVLVVLAVALPLQFQQTERFDTDLLALLPSTEKNSIVEEAVRNFTRSVGDRVVLLIEHPEKPIAPEKIDKAVEVLQQSAAFESLIYKLPEKVDQQYRDFYSAHSTKLLSVSRGSELESDGAAEKLLAGVQRALYTPFALSLIHI